MQVLNKYKLFLKINFKLKLNASSQIIKFKLSIRSKLSQVNSKS